MNSFNKKIYTIVIIILVLVLAAALVFLKLGTFEKGAGGGVSDKIPPTESGQPAGTPTPENTDEPLKTTEPDSGDDSAAALAEIVEKSMSGAGGKCQWGFSVLSEGVSYTSASYAAPSASVIKVFIMEYVFSLIEKGELSMDSTIEGCSVNNLLYDMITWSDNTATNIFIGYFGMDKMNAFFAGCGYADTRLERKMLDTAAQSAGKENYTSVNDTMRFLKKLYNNQNEKPYSDMLGIMKKQQVSTKIRRRFDSSVIIANKTGELSNVENDIGIIFGSGGDVAVSFMCSSLSDTASARDAISRAAYELAKKTVLK